MALYKDGNPVSGINSIPRLTLAQYNALTVKPEVWIRTDAPESYKKVTASDVSYDNTSSGLTASDVQAAIDETLSIGNGAIKHINWTSGTTENDITFGQFLLSFTYNGTSYTDVEICGYRYAYYVSWTTPPGYRYAYVGQVLGGSQLQGTVIFHDTWSGQVTIIGNSFPVAHNTLTLHSELTKSSSKYTGTYYRYGPCLVVVINGNYYDSKWLSMSSDLNRYIAFRCNGTDYQIYFNNGGAFDANFLPDGAIVRVYTMG